MMGKMPVHAYFSGPGLKNESKDSIMKRKSDTQSGEDLESSIQ